jgi:hypothetical protein
MLPGSSFGPIHLAHALRKLDRTKEAHETLLPVADKFTDEWRIPFQLGCYWCQLGDRKEAFQWVKRAIDVAGKLDIWLKALDEPDLETLWPAFRDMKPNRHLKRRAIRQNESAWSDSA